MHEFDTYLTIGGRYDDSRKPLVGGLNVTGSPQQGSEALVAWNEQNPARGIGLRFWATPFPTYNDSTCVATAPANTAALELEARISGFGGAWTRRRFVVNTGQESVLGIGEYEAGEVTVISAVQAYNGGIVGSMVPGDAVLANFTWLKEMPDSLAVAQRLVSRLYEITTLDAVVPTRVVVPPGTIDMEVYSPVFACPVDVNWQGIGAGGGFAPGAARVTGALVPQTVLPVVAGGAPLPLAGAKFVDLLAPVGWPYTTLTFRFNLAPL